MVNKGLGKLILLSGAGLSGFLVGSYFENKHNLLNTLKLKHTHKSYPGLPLFGTVSAATPFTPALKEQGSASRVSQIMKYGFPGLDNVRSFDDYVLSYDRRNKVAHWVFEHLTKDNTKYNPEVERSKCDFKPDESIHPYFR